MVVASPIINALHAKGHEITVISTHQPLNIPSNRTNYEVIIASKAAATFSSLLDKNIGLKSRMDPILSRIPGYLIYPFLVPHICEAFYASEEVQAWIQSQPKVDLMFMDTMADCPLALRHKLGAKLILLNLVTPTLFLMDYVGIPFESIPYIEIGNNQFPLSFLERVKSVAGSAINQFLLSVVKDPKLDEIAAKYLGPDIPSIKEMSKKDISLVFQNSHQLEDFGRALPPNVISIPGIHIQKFTSPLNKV